MISKSRSYVFARNPSHSGRRRNNLIALVGTKGCGEIAAAFGLAMTWLMNNLLTKYLQGGVQ
jgi:glycosyltransferase A (GT-A) superfamily protein (DUF2064 family)